MNDTMRYAWSHFVEIIHRMKETAVEITDPKNLAEHLKVIFRDESKFIFHVYNRNELLNNIFFHFSCTK